MTENKTENESETAFSNDDYRERLRIFDTAVCEAMAVSQATANRNELPAIGYSTHVFTRMCGHAQALLCAAPTSRWVKRDFEIWDVSAVASHARSILEGYLLFRYLADAPTDLEIQRAYVQVMHLYDCLKRINILPHVLPPDEIKGLKAQAEKIKKRLEGIQYFSDLEPKTKKKLIEGDRLTITPRNDLISAVGIDKDEFYFFWNYLSQYTHVFSFTFYRIEPDGRGTGLKNDFDRDALCMVLEFSASLMIQAVDRLVEIFPDATEVRNGLDSKFSPGPRRNLPKHIKKSQKRKQRK